MNSDNKKKGRYNIIDLIAGFAMLYIMFFHFCYDLKFIFNQDIVFFPTRWTEYGRFIAVFIFMTISGMTLHFSSRHIPKFIKLSIVAIGISLITYLLFPKELVLFGIIHFFAFGTLVMMFLELVLKYINGYVGFALSMLGFYITWPITRGFIQLPTETIELSKSLYDVKYLFWLGFPGPGFQSADYYPMLPWIFLLIGGYFIGKIYLSHNPKRRPKSYNPITIIGRNRLLFYILHQPLFYVLLSYYFKRPLL
ncbi:heparan-alpha-glucosaminide N-acetyltransferase [Lagierella sp.]|uniref:heparan-alpha-glucosaminide N-acetyltransferase n=1 Tax=Lagierella sp. TaxID=2849657 RepID=UPI00263943F6|nr:heparan-alpha-glucosaminide N-acetyltransferase [Lagierella sp.]